MFCYIPTPKKEIDKDKKTSLVLDNKNQIIEDSKKFKKNNFKKAISKKINLFNNKIKLKKKILSNI